MKSFHNIFLFFSKQLFISNNINKRSLCNLWHLMLILSLFFFFLFFLFIRISFFCRLYILFRTERSRNSHCSEPTRIPPRLGLARFNISFHFRKLLGHTSKRFVLLCQRSIVREILL